MTAKDVAVMILIILGVLGAWMVATDFGRPPYSPLAGYIPQIVFSLYTTTMTAAGVVASIFIGAMIFFVYKFREREGHEDR